MDGGAWWAPEWHDWVTSLSLFTFMQWRRKWQPTPVFLPGESPGRGSLVGCRLWGCTVGHNWSDLAAYMTVGKTIIALTGWTFVSKVMSLLFNTLSMLVIAFLPRSKCLLISWLLSPSAVILEFLRKKSLTVSPSICYEEKGWDAMILFFWMLSFKPVFFTGPLFPLHFLP